LMIQVIPVCCYESRNSNNIEQGRHIKMSNK
jgi:hypothetical protein